jgi:hypothetical protein
LRDRWCTTDRASRSRPDPSQIEDIGFEAVLSSIALRSLPGCRRPGLRSIPSILSRWRASGSIGGGPPRMYGWGGLGCEALDDPAKPSVGEPLRQHWGIIPLACLLELDVRLASWLRSQSCAPTRPAPNKPAIECSETMSVVTTEGSRTGFGCTSTICAA